MTATPEQISALNDASSKLSAAAAELTAKQAEKSATAEALIAAQTADAAKADEYTRAVQNLVTAGETLDSAIAAVKG